MDGDDDNEGVPESEQFNSNPEISPEMEFEREVQEDDSVRNRLDNDD